MAGSSGATNRSIVNVRTWGGFLRRLAAIQRSTTRPLLFRGHGDARYLIQSTLERRGRASVTVIEFFEATVHARRRRVARRRRRHVERLMRALVIVAMQERVEAHLLMQHVR